MGIANTPGRAFEFSSKEISAPLPISCVHSSISNTICVVRPCVPSGRSTIAVGHARQDDAGRCSPHERERLGADSSALAVLVELVAGLYGDGAVFPMFFLALKKRRTWLLLLCCLYLRHQSCAEDLEDQCGAGQNGTEVAPNACHGGRDSNKER